MPFGKENIRFGVLCLSLELRHIVNAVAGTRDICVGLNLQAAHQAFALPAGTLPAHVTAHTGPP